MRATHQAVDEAFSLLVAEGRTFVTVTLVDAVGSTPGEVGGRMLVTEDGALAGTVGGGRLEARALDEARELLAGQGEHRFVDWSLNRDIGMTCGGRVKLFFQLHNGRSWSIHIFGAGHVAQALVRLLLNLNCRIHCYDTRDEWLARLPASPRLVRHRSEVLAAEVAGIPEQGFVLLMTMGHATDLPVLAEFLRKGNQAYLGVIGSRSKRAVLHRELLASGIDPGVAENFYCPIGLPIGSDDPAEIAVSVVAQLLEVRDRLAMTARTPSEGAVHG